MIYETKKGITKGELLELLKDVPDDAEILIASVTTYDDGNRNSGVWKVVNHVMGKRVVIYPQQMKLLANGKLVTVRRC